MSVRRRLITWLGRAPRWASRLCALWGGLALAIGAIVALVLMEPASPLQVSGLALAFSLLVWSGGPALVLAGLGSAGVGLVGLARLDASAKPGADDPGRASGPSSALGALALSVASLAGAGALGWAALSDERLRAPQSTTVFAVVAALGVVGAAAAIAAAFLWRRGSGRAPAALARGPAPWLHIGILSVLTAVSALLQLALLDWFIEDAAISFAYARHFASGDGLVTYVGGERVEGYSNPLWTFLLAAFYLVGVDGFVSSKALGLAFGAACVPLTWAIAREVRPASGDPVPLLAAAILAGSTQHVVWAASGLENSLLNALLAAAIWRGAVEGRAGGAPWSALLWLGVAVTRPEGLLYAAIGGAAWLAGRGATEIGRRGGLGGARALLAPTAGWLALFFVPFAAYHAWRYSYFAWEFPNTYYAKKGNPSKSFEPLKWDHRGWRYVRDYASEYGYGLLLPVQIAAATGLRGARAWVGVAAVLALAIVLLLPGPEWLRATGWWDLPVPRWWTQLRVVALASVGVAALVAAVGRPGWRALVPCLAIAQAAVFFAVYAGGDWMGAYRWMATLAVPQAVVFAVGLGELAGAAARAVDQRGRGYGVAVGVALGLAALVVGAALAWPPTGVLPLANLRLRPVDAVTTLAAGAALLVGVGWAAARAGRRWGPAAWTVALLGVVAVVLPAAHGLDRFIDKPTTSPFAVRKRANYVRDIAERLHLTERPAILDVDMGAIMYWSGGELSDIAGLVDVSMGHHWFEPAFLDEYLHRERNPHFAHVHGGWARTSGIDRRPWWEPGYLELPAYKVSKKKTHGGNHVRRDLIVVDRWPAEPGLPATFEGGPTLVGLDAPAATVAPGGHLFVEIAWRLDAPVERPDEVRAVLWLAADGAPIQSWELPFGYDWYPLPRWQVGEVVYARHSLRVPESAPLGAADLGIVLLRPDGSVAPTGWGAPVVGPGDGDVARFAASELRWPDRVAISTPDRVRAEAEADVAEVRRLAAEGDCTGAEARWVVAQRRTTRTGFADEVRRAVSDALAACRARAAERASERSEQVAELARAHRWRPHGPEQRRVRAPLVARWWDEGLRARAQGDHDEAFAAFTAIVTVDPSRSWARRYAEEARDCRLGIDRSGRCPRERSAAPLDVGALPAAPAPDGGPEPVGDDDDEALPAPDFGARPAPRLPGTGRHGAVAPENDGGSPRIGVDALAPAAPAAGGAAAPAGAPDGIRALDPRFAPGGAFGSRPPGPVSGARPTQAPIAEAP